MASTRRPRKAKKAVLVVDAVAQQTEPLEHLIKAEAEVKPAKPKRTRAATTRKKQAAEPKAEPVSAAHRALLAALEATGAGAGSEADTLEARAEEGVVYTRSAPRLAPPAPVEPESDELALPTAPANVGIATRLKLALKAIDRLPPIRLPLGPTIPWRFGLPGLLALVLCMAVLSRTTAHAETSNGFKLPAESETYAVTQDSPLFAKTQAQQPQQPIGVAEPAGLNVDVMDLTLKLVAVLALAYGSLAVLKRLGIGGAGSASSGASGTASEGLRVLSTLALAPNRSIHVVRAPDGKTLLLGATPGQVNLIAELGEVPEVAAGGPGSFLDVLTSKLQQH